MNDKKDMIAKLTIRDRLVINPNRKDAVFAGFVGDLDQDALVSSVGQLGLGAGDWHRYGNHIVFTDQGVDKLLAADIGSPVLNLYAELIGKHTARATRGGGGMERG